MTINTTQRKEITMTTVAHPMDVPRGRVGYVSGTLLRQLAFIPLLGAAAIIVTPGQSGTGILAILVAVIMFAGCRVAGTRLVEGAWRRIPHLAHAGDGPLWLDIARETTNLALFAALLGILLNSGDVLAIALVVLISGMPLGILLIEASWPPPGCPPRKRTIAIIRIPLYAAVALAMLSPVLAAATSSGQVLSVALIVGIGMLVSAAVAFYGTATRRRSS